MDSKAIIACAITPANHPEQEALEELKSDIDAQGIHFSEAHFDRAYMGSVAVNEIVEDGGEVICKPWKVQNGNLFTKEEFDIDLRAKQLHALPAMQKTLSWAEQYFLILTAVTAV